MIAVGFLRQKSRDRVGLSYPTPSPHEVVVTPAGHGSVLKALAASVPLVCMPLGRDQKDNTVRVLRIGAGVRVSKGERPAGIAASVRWVRDQPAYRRAAQELAATLAHESATHPDAADEAEALLGA